MHCEYLFCVLIFISSSIYYASGERTKEKMYENLEGSNVCFRRMNATHQIGCSSKEKGSLGVIHFCERLEDLDFILKNGTADPYIPVLPTHLFTREVVRRLIDSDKVSGLLLYKSNATPQHFTHEKKCPNMGYGLKNTCEKDWNPYGTGLLYEDIPFAIFYIDTESNVNKVKKCYEKFNAFDMDKQNTRSLCSLQMNSFMYGTTDTPTCLRRTNINKKVNLNPVKFCDPLGDQNVWAALFPLVKGPNKTEPVENYKYIIVSARIDSTSLFDKTAGAVIPVTGLVALLTTAKLLKEMLPNDNNYGKNVLFVLFNGETYDYIGSQRLLYDMTKGNFPIENVNHSKSLPAIKPEDIELFIEFSQLSDTGKVVTHFYKNTSEVDQLYQDLKLHRGNLKLLRRSELLPPSSAQTFIKSKDDLPAVVLADHTDSYANPYYNSIYDNASNIKFEYFNTTDPSSISEDSIQIFLANVSTMVAKSIRKFITGNDEDGENHTADVLVVNELLYCYLENPACKVHQAIQKLKFQSRPFSMYVGVNDPRSQNPLTTLVGLTLGWFTGDDIGEGNATCVNEPRNYAFRFFNMSKSISDLNTTRCFRTTMNFTEAVSPAFKITDYAWSSGLYSSWTESTWNEISLRLFLKPSAAHEALTLSLGIVTFAASLVVVYFLKSRSHILFSSIPITQAPTNC